MITATHSPTPRPNSQRRYLLIALKVVVSVGLLAVLFAKIDVTRLWAAARQASLAWFAVALALYFLNVLVSVWRWQRLLGAQDLEVPDSRLMSSYLVALFFNNFLPSNIGGDVIRISDTAGAAGSKTVATLVILSDRVLGLIGLVLVSAVGASVASGGATHPAPIWPVWLWAGFAVAAIVSAPAVLAPAGIGRLLQPLTVLHPEWVGDRIESTTAVLYRFREHPGAIASCFCGAVSVQGIMVLFYVAVAHALHVNVSPWDLAVIVPLSFLIQMAPVSLNGFGVREATFSFYFARLGLPIESGLLVSLASVSLMMLFSLSGAVVYVARGRH
jgi:uncharacterized membrane protein YbhN (UPF0104 family)